MPNLFHRGDINTKKIGKRPIPDHVQVTLENDRIGKKRSVSPLRSHPGEFVEVK